MMEPKYGDVYATATGATKLMIVGDDPARQAHFVLVLADQIGRYTDDEPWMTPITDQLLRDAYQKVPE